jgi:hypothetical protein
MSDKMLIQTPCCKKCGCSQSLKVNKGYYDKWFALNIQRVWPDLCPTCWDKASQERTISRVF